MSRCVGHCCRVFSLPMRPEELRASRDPEATKIAGMVIYLGHYLSTELPGAPPQNEGVREHFYTCINRNTVTGDCMAYETRPRMCREFPYGSQCPYPDCADDTRPDVPIRKLTRKVFEKQRSILSASLTHAKKYPYYPHPDATPVERALADALGVDPSTRTKEG